MQDIIIFTLCIVGIVNRILSWKALVPLSRLTYMAYLVHPIVMESYNFQLKYPFNYDDYSIVSARVVHKVMSCVS